MFSLHSVDLYNLSQDKIKSPGKPTTQFSAGQGREGKGREMVIDVQLVKHAALSTLILQTFLET